MEPTSRRVNQRDVPQTLAWVVVVLIAVRVASVVFLKKDEPELIRWVTLNQAQVRSTTTGKLIMYDFSAAWCGPCRQMDAAVFRDPRSASRINDMVVPVRVVDRQQEDGKNPPDIEALQRRFEIRAFPTVVIVDDAGRLRGRMEGFQSRAAFFEMLDDAARFSRARRN